MSEKELNCWQDFFAAQIVVLNAVRRGPLLVALIITLSFFDSILGNLLPQWVASALGQIGYFATLGLSCRVIYETWSVINAVPRSDPKQDYACFLNVWGNNLLYGFAFVAGCLLFLAPGFYIALVGSLGIVFVCLEQLKVIQAFEASRQLIKKRFWLSAAYLAPAILGFGLAIGLVFLIVGMLIAKFAPELIFVILCLQGCLRIWETWVILCLVSLQVRLYKYLKETLVD